MKVIGLTGGMGMGKSTVAALFQQAGIPVFDADATVRQLQADHGAALGPIAVLVPEAVTNGHLDRAVLRRAVVERPGLLRQLEVILHPMVRAARQDFLTQHRRQGARCVLLDIPLLFETGGQRLCDHVLLVSAPPRLQADRVARRRSLPKAEARKLIARQMPDARKRRLADTVIETGVALSATRRQVRALIKGLNA
ncbi:dephospho-CoA kinase [Acetobacter orleanensis]|uniref:Dephospho-CoA kinase n=1 Tax=Acetobacter orleanensis TaxID=104099 RepID=A0A4Y3TI60_9PROT|nr:dephospho-CoA kinase [Acetobacter orleanensis]KXV62810.1 dephospho-CoA kinase [Acetobacter orleanensis]PCD80586.1 dephospho-CoA kinase [Acetobacter orleanensis]GAN68100.1 dephospho-CoA kinase [Acetobacter orleanensis JCM 7639]GBR27036.1 dephospho-CoA kinase [Acetobacter orleanensis NRIC 0473]GEB81976.1 dephospho-CoA kinase [Acetobacter orleanensis]